MSHDQRTTVSRRRALQTGGLAALTAGLIGATGTTTLARAEAPASDLLAALCTVAARPDPPSRPGWPSWWPSGRRTWSSTTRCTTS
jgi:hypothetical protein